MEHKFGLKFGLDPEKIWPIWLCIIPGTAMFLGGLGILAWGISDYYDSLEIGLYDKEWLDSQLKYTIFPAAVLIVVGILLVSFLFLFRTLYKTGFWCPYGFTFNDQTGMLTVHHGHKGTTFHIQYLQRVKISNTGLDSNGRYNTLYHGKKRDYGYIKLYYLKNGHKRSVSPYGMIHGVEGAKMTLDDLISQVEQRKNGNY